jgi:hypothetical protein
MLREGPLAMEETTAARPHQVPGPMGPLTLADLPPADTKRWVARRKAEVLAAIRGGLIDRAEARRRWQVSDEELRLWERALDCAGVPGLRVTRVQIYRPVFEAASR